MLQPGALGVWNLAPLVAGPERVLALIASEFLPFDRVPRGLGVTNTPRLGPLPIVPLCHSENQEIQGNMAVSNEMMFRDVPPCNGFYYVKRT